MCRALTEQYHKLFQINILNGSSNILFNHNSTYIPGEIHTALSFVSTGNILTTAIPRITLYAHTMLHRNERPGLSAEMYLINNNKKFMWVKVTIISCF
jgi:hypothetical protein